MHTPYSAHITFAHGPLCCMHLHHLYHNPCVGILHTSCSTCLLLYVQSQLILTHHSIPIHPLFPDTHSLPYMAFSTHIYLSLCSHFLLCVHFPPCAHSVLHLSSSLSHAHYFFTLTDTFVQLQLCHFLLHPHASLYIHLLLMYTFGSMLT